MRKLRTDRKLKQVLTKGDLILEEIADSVERANIRIEVNSVIAVKYRSRISETETPDKPGKCEITWRYTRAEISWLERNNKIPEILDINNIPV